MVLDVLAGLLMEQAGILPEGETLLIISELAGIPLPRATQPLPHLVQWDKIIFSPYYPIRDFGKRCRKPVKFFRKSINRLTRWPIKERFLDIRLFGDGAGGQY